MLRVQVIAARPHVCLARELQLEEGATVADAARLAALDAGEVAGYAVFGLRVEPSTVLRDGDRVEVLRPLQADPKEARRQRARRQRGG
ncbi:RnfH family protein [Pseudoxanthomonas sp. 10H]|uniref:RnfH family protein n=1 Tax=Pseudoxanthomonas sp. 10H TaxID=3242729 RepID=UPI0035577721